MQRTVVSPEGELIDFEDLPRGFIRSAYDGSSVLVFEEPGDSLTVQSDEPSSNVNVMVKRWLSGQPLPEVRPMQFGDVSEVVDLQTASNKLASLREAFMRFPADIRSEFDNDALAFAEFVADPNNVEEGRKLGIFEPAAGAKAPVEAPPVPPAGDKPA